MMSSYKPSLVKTRSNSVVIKRSPSVASTKVPSPRGDGNDRYQIHDYCGGKVVDIVPRKSPQTDDDQFPTSLMLGEEMVLHPSHPQHALSQLYLPDRFTCTACKEYGAGKRFTCPHCMDVQLHHFCAFAPPALKAHPLHFQHQLVFYSRPVKGGISQSKCDVCSKAIKGCAYHCSACSFQIHPCCALLSSQIHLPSIHPHPLIITLLSETSSSSGDSSMSSNFVCGECKKQRSKPMGRVYRCTVCDYHVHAVCAKDMINGLRENGIKVSEKSSVLGKAARLASQIVVEFIEGIFEGLGESVGQVLVQNIARGTANAANTNNRFRDIPSDH